MLQESGSSLWISALFMLVLLVAVFIVAKKQQGSNKRGEKQLKVIEKLVVGTNRTLMVVKAGEKVLLVGMTLQHMSLLSELDGDEWKSILKNQQSSGEGFANILGGFMNKSKMENPLAKFTGNWRP